MEDDSVHLYRREIIYLSFIFLRVNCILKYHVENYWEDQRYVNTIRSRNFNVKFTSRSCQFLNLRTQSLSASSPWKYAYTSITHVSSPWKYILHKASWLKDGKRCRNLSSLHSCQFILKYIFMSITTYQFLMLV